MKLLDEYLELQQEVYDYFAYEELWSTYAIVDARKYSWVMHDQILFYSKEDVLNAIKSDREYYTGIVREMAYKNKGYTMMVVDTGADSNIYLAIFDDRKNVLTTQLMDVGTGEIIVFPKKD